MNVIKWGLVAILVAALQVSAFAVGGDSEYSSTIGGSIFGFLKKDRSPYLVNESLVVPEGKALVIESGVELRFKEGTGLDVRGGSLAVTGAAGNEVIFNSADSGKYWNGVSVTGVKRSEVQGLVLKDAVYGFTVESGALEIQNSIIENIQSAGIYVRNGSAEIQWTKILKSKNVGVWATQSSSVEIDGSTLANNRIALVAGDESSVNLSLSKLEENEIAVYDMGNNHLKQSGTFIGYNEIAFATIDFPPLDFKGKLTNNDMELSNDVSSLEKSLGEEPRNPYADGMKLHRWAGETADSVWNISGNAVVEVGYHKVFMRHNHSGEPYASGSDTVYNGDLYNNYFQVPGLFANWNANLVMQSPYGQTFEVTTDISSDSWNNFKLHLFRASYKDRMQQLILGDFYANAGELYLAGINAFGGYYNINLFENVSKDPLFVLDAFVGETKAPKIEGKKNYDTYKDYIEDGEAEAQEIVIGEKIRWNMHRRFNGTLGYIGSNSYLDDPILRDGMSSQVNTASPLVDSRTFFADGNWLFYPGDIKLNGQVSVGGADTANVEKMRAINQVFSDAGLDASNFALLNKLMSDPKRVNTLSAEQLESIYGENSQKTPSEMRAELRELLMKAREVAAESHPEDANPSKGNFWGHEHWAFAGSYQWSDEHTFIEGFLRYVGREYYSAGSPDLLQNTRMIGGNLRRDIYDFWNLTFGYTMNVENAADEGNGYNIFGLAEGSHWGFTGTESDWLDEHEEDPNRALYVHDGYLGNEFKLNEWISLGFKYSLDYRTRSTPLRLYANYSAGSGVYEDPWFRPFDESSSTIQVFTEDDTLEIDSSRWAQYYGLADESYLASRFLERIIKHSLELNVTLQLPQKNTLRAGVNLVVRSDMSKFEDDDLISSFDFEDETYGILGYYFHGGDYTELRFPISLSTALDGFRNTFAMTPRYKMYTRNEMRELEWNFMDNLNIALSRNFLELSLAGGLRLNFLDYEIDDEKYEEDEYDIDGSCSLRVYHTQRLYSDWTVGALFNYRPDNRSDEYKDFYMMAALNYDF